MICIRWEFGLNSTYFAQASRLAKLFWPLSFFNTERITFAAGFTIAQNNQQNRHSPKKAAESAENVRGSSEGTFATYGAYRPSKQKSPLKPGDFRRWFIQRRRKDPTIPTRQQGLCRLPRLPPLRAILLSAAIAAPVPAHWSKSSTDGAGGRKS